MTPRETWAEAKARWIASLFDPDPTNFQLGEIAAALREAENRGLDLAIKELRSNCHGGPHLMESGDCCDCEVCALRKEVEGLKHPPEGGESNGL